MKKQSRHFIILIAVLVVLAAGYFILMQYNEHQQEKEANQTEGEVLAELTLDEIERFSYVYEGETHTFEKKTVEAQEETESQWVAAEDSSLQLDQSRLDTMAGKFIHVVAQDTVTGVTDLSQYGLEEPSNVLHWETAEKSYTYYVGDYNTIAGVYYLCEPDTDTVYTVKSSMVLGFNYSLEDLVVEEEVSSEEAAETETK